MQDVISKLREKAVEASKKAYAPYSGFKIGASILTTTNKIYSGQNIENSSYGATVCAERVAIFNAISDGEIRIKKIYIHSKTGWPPCGLCLQVISEFAEKDLEVIIGDENGVKKKMPFSKMFPLAFTPDKLKE
ncbi:MAG: cytidine deaminase [Bacteriovoracaceae bacterium]|nr:cytidine deaminase [Bacteriovoracaceae bacterium]